MKTNGPEKLLFIIDRLQAVVLSKSGPSLFSKSHDQFMQTQACTNWFHSDLSAPVKNVDNNHDDQGNAKATLFIHSNSSRLLQRVGQRG